MSVVIGVDGGGSKTYAVVVDESGRRLGSGTAGGGNHQTDGIEPALRNIRASMDMALQEAKLAPEDVAFVQYGLSGYDREVDFSIVRPALTSLPYPNWEVVCDTMEGLRAGSRDNVGVVLVCGSGTNAAGRNPEGQTVQTGGLGYLYGDGTGGSDIARETFRAAVRSWELREVPSLLTEAVPRFLGFSTMAELVNDYWDKGVQDVPIRLTEVLHQVAGENDELAIRLLRNAGYELGIAAMSVVRRLGGFEGQTVPVVLVGSVLQRGRNPHLLDALQTEIERAGIAYRLVIPEQAPVYGSVMLAMDRLHIPVTERMEQLFTAYGGHQA